MKFLDDLLAQPEHSDGISVQLQVGVRGLAGALRASSDPEWYEMQVPSMHPTTQQLLALWTFVRKSEISSISIITNAQIESLKAPSNGGLIVPGLVGRRS